MVPKGGAKLYYLHRPEPTAAEATPEPSRVRMRVSRTPMPLFDALAGSARNIPEASASRAELGAKVAGFMSDSSSALDQAVKEHAKNFFSGFYNYDDPGGAEQTRQIGGLTVAIHLAENVEEMWGALAARADAGSSALFEAALDHISEFLGPGYYSKTPGDIRLGFFGFEDLMNSCLRVLELEERIMPLQRMIETNIPRLVELTRFHFERLEQH